MHVVFSSAPRHGEHNISCVNLFFKKGTKSKDTERNLEALGKVEVHMYHWIRNQHLSSEVIGGTCVPSGVLDESKEYACMKE